MDTVSLSSIIIAVFAVVAGVVGVSIGLRGKKRAISAVTKVLEVSHATQTENRELRQRLRDGRLQNRVAEIEKLTEELKVKTSVDRTDLDDLQKRLQKLKELAKGGK